MALGDGVAKNWKEPRSLSQWAEVAPDPGRVTGS